MSLEETVRRTTAVRVLDAAMCHHYYMIGGGTRDARQMYSSSPKLIEVRRVDQDGAGPCFRTNVYMYLYARVKVEVGRPISLSLGSLFVWLYLCQIKWILLLVRLRVLLFVVIVAQALVYSYDRLLRVQV